MKESAVDRETELERRFGDPFDDDNPVGFGALLAADERAELLPEGERLLTEWGCNLEFVPARLGGNWRGVDELGRRLRPVFRRDPALGLGYGVTSLMASVNMWVAGSMEQQRGLAAELRMGHRIAVAFHELEHGNDFLRNALRAELDGDRAVLTGVKEVINNVERAESLALFARTSGDAGARSHSVLWLRKKQLSAGRLRYLPRFRTSGMRGCRIGGIAFDGSEVPAELVGAAGSGVETALRGFQITRTVLPSMAVGVLDSALHIVHRFVTERKLYGHRVSDLPHARTTLAEAFTDLLIADCLATSAARLLHLAPRNCAAPAAAVKYLVPMLLQDAVQDLSEVLGARFYLREGPFAAFGKLYRDLPVVSLGHAGPTACLLTIIPQLPALARRAWHPEAPPAALFDTEAELPRLDFARLSLAGTSADPLAAALLAEAERVDAAEPVRELAGQWRALAAECSLLSGSELGPAASAETFELGERYALLLAASACVGIWRQQRGASGFLGSDEWIHAALRRLSGRLRGDATPLPEQLAEPLFAELTRRVGERESCSLHPTPVFRSAP